jgi:hypothetical protein
MTLTDADRHMTRGASRALARLILALAAFEAIAALLRGFLPDVPAFLFDLAAVTRCAFAVRGLTIALALRPIARATHRGLHARTSAALFALSALLALLRFFDIVPMALGDALWDGLLQVLRVTALLGALALLLQLLSRLAPSLRGAPPSLILAFGVSLATIEPHILPHPLVAPLLALTLPWVYFATRLLRGAPLALALLPGLAAALLPIVPIPPLAPTALLALGADHAFASAGLAMAGLALTLILALPPALHELTDTLSGRDSAGPSRTFLRRILGAPEADGDQRLGDLSASSTAPPSSDEGQLDLAMRELGLTPSPTKSHAQPIELGQVLPFTPRTRPPTAPSLPVTGATPARGAARPLTEARALRTLQASLLARGLILAFGLLLMNSPLGRLLPFLVAFDLALLIASVPLARATARLIDLAPARLIGRVAALAGLLLVLFEFALLALRVIEPLAPLRPTLVIGSTLALFIALGLIIGVLARVFRAEGEARLATRATQALTLLIALASALAAHAFVDALDASDLAWLAWPLGLAATGLGLGTWLSVLWLLRDGTDVLAPAGLDER